MPRLLEQIASLDRKDNFFHYCYLNESNLPRSIWVVRGTLFNADTVIRKDDWIVEIRNTANPAALLSAILQVVTFGV